MDTMKLLCARPGQHWSAQAGNGNCLGWLHSHRSDRPTRYIKNLAKVSLEVNETLLLSLESYSQKEAIMITNSRVSLVTPIRGDEADLCTAGI